MIDLTINNMTVTVPEGTTILEAARKVQVNIPTLCHLDLHNDKFINKSASCRVCVVEVEGRPNLVPACSTMVSQGMVVKTSTPQAIECQESHRGTIAFGPSVGLPALPAQYPLRSAESGGGAGYKRN